MNIIVNGTGQLRHRFWGDYSAVIGIVFDNAADANLALPKLGADWSSNNETVIWSGNSEQLKIQKKNLASFGADEDKIDSIKYSVDYGEPFNIKIPVDFVDPNQLNLFK